MKGQSYQLTLSLTLEKYIIRESLDRKILFPLIGYTIHMLPFLHYYILCFDIITYNGIFCVYNMGIITWLWLTNGFCFVKFCKILKQEREFMGFCFG